MTAALAETLLVSACELSYDVAREGVEADPAVDPPALMRSFLYVSEPPARAMDLARQAIDEDNEFRNRVAKNADEYRVGKAGVLWLTRPDGWEAEIEAMVNGDGSAGYEETATEFGAIENDTTTNVRSSSSGDDNGVTDQGVYDGGDAVSNSDNGNGFVAATNGRASSETDPIDDELSSLRGLVERLSHERKSSPSTARRGDDGLDASITTGPAMFDADVYALQSDLEVTRSDLERARVERDTAVRQHSESLTRQLELEKELSRARDQRAHLESEHAAVDLRLVELQEALSRSERAANSMRQQEAELQSQLAAIRTENDDLQNHLTMVAEEKTSHYQTLEVAYNTLKADADSLRDENARLTDRATLQEEELVALRADAELVERKSADSTALVEALTEEKIDLASRLADTEAMLETTRTQINAVKADAEAVTVELVNVRDHRDGLASQVEELHGSLSEALTNLAAVRAASDSDREALKSTRTERDQLRVRVTRLEEVEESLANKVEATITERDDAQARAEQARTDLVDRERKYSELSIERDRLIDEIATTTEEIKGLTGDRSQLASTVERLESELKETRSNRDLLAQQVDQLTEENAGIQSQLVESDRLRVETAESQGHALSELAHRLAMVETERNRFEREMRAAEDRLIDAMAKFDAANKPAADKVRDETGQSLPLVDRSTVTAGSSRSALDEITSRRSEVGSRSSSSASGLSSGSRSSSDSSDSSDSSAGATRSISLTAVPSTGSGTKTDAAADARPGDKSTSDTGGVSDTTNRWSLSSIDSTSTTSASAGSRHDQDRPASDRSGFTANNDHDDDAGLDPRGHRGATVTPLGNGYMDDMGTGRHDQIDDISSELALVTGGGETDEDLDAISSLISQTVTDFDPANLPVPDFDPAVNGQFDSGAKPRAAGSAPPSVFGDSPGGRLPADGSDLRSVPGSDPGASKLGRRQIDVPNDLYEDEIELARHVVSAPDVVLLVDGDSVSKMGWPSLPVAQQRDALVSYLAELSAGTGVAPDVVFDGRVGEEDSLPVSRAVRIRLSTPPTEPTAALDELVDAYPEQWPIAVVCDHPELAKSAVERGATVLSNGQLLDLFIDDQPVDR